MNETEQTTTNTNTGDFTLDDIYFKDAFTQTEDKLNLEVDNANISCLTSKNNKFSLDEDGNLIVNSISVGQNSSAGIIDFNQIYPIGSIYLSANSVNPSVLFGGIWEQIKDTFLLACGDKHVVGTTGGSEKHSHAYGIRVGAYYSNTKFAEDSDAGLLNYDVNNNTSLVTPSTVLTGVPTTLNSGVGAGQWYATSNYDQAVARASYENTYPTYLAVYVWKRVS